MSKELDALYEIKRHHINMDAIVKYENGDETQYRFETIRDMFPQEFNILENALKALEIIKKKAINVFILLHSGDLETYNDMVEENRKLTQEEFDLLKKVILWVKLNSLLLLS